MRKTLTKPQAKQLLKILSEKAKVGRMRTKGNNQKTTIPRP